MEESEIGGELEERGFSVCEDDDRPTSEEREDASEESERRFIISRCAAEVTGGRDREDRTFTMDTHSSQLLNLLLKGTGCFRGREKDFWRRWLDGEEVVK